MEPRHERAARIALEAGARYGLALAGGYAVSAHAVANKVGALFGRALPRDFLDADAAIMSGRYTRGQLLELAAEADHGFDRLLSPTRSER